MRGINDSMCDDIKTAMSQQGIDLNTEVMTKCLSLCSSLHITAETMAESWMAYSLNKNIMDLDDISFDPFRSYLLKELEPKQEVGAIVKKRRVEMTPPPPKKARKNIPNPTPHKISVSPSKTFSFETRSDAGKVMVSYNPANVDVEKVKYGKCDIDTRSFEDTNARDYRYMFTTVEDRADALNDQAVLMGEIISEENNLEEIIKPVGTPHQDKVCLVGRICNEAHEGRLNATSIEMEGSRDKSQGQRIKVDVSNVKSYSMFSGQVVAVEGLNPTGRSITAEKIYDGVSLSKLKHEGKNSRPVHIMTVTGPYTLEKDSHYTPLRDFLLLVKEIKPSLVIMTGPYVTDADTLEMDDGTDMPVSFETVFQHKIVAMLDLIFQDDNPTQFVILPSLDDKLSQPVYPQPPLSDRIPEGKLLTFSDADIDVGTLSIHTLPRNRVHLLPNPATIAVNDLTVGVTSTDILLHLSSDEIHRNLPQNRIATLAQHLMKQKSYYPLFPAHMSTPVDLKRLDQFAMPCHPDILILPSMLAPFCRKVMDTLVVNPGYLIKGNRSGTYGNIWVSEAGEKVEIKKI
eukprot:CAMPEP_0172500080 /NCGR_PEP_ID=MMETSP1066-20121228/134475_1 /TAXON_ID=671091 /ORGANISM="Coscinodiscus wailesii, Strain CCMP2513" /LENGTH=570 /DNA_ID=CAMNT_0013274157 /DNA_START=155 /DNA_END=1867 /DNA_ORIENTATION=+